LSEGSVIIPDEPFLRIPYSRGRWGEGVNPSPTSVCRFEGNVFNTAPQENERSKGEANFLELFLFRDAGEKCLIHCRK
jgi:hypothetical protein